MTGRAASSTAVLVCQGRAVAHGHFAVERFSDPVAWQLLDPQERGVVEQARAGQAPEGGRDRMTYELVRRTGMLMVPRTVAIDDAVRAHGAAQVVVLGAGLDARAWRMPELAVATVFEVDHPASQQEKRRRIGDLEPVAGSVVPVAVGQVAGLAAPGSVLVVNYQSRSLTASLMRRVMRVVLRLTRQPDPLAGEPWRSTWSPGTMRNLLSANGFETTSDDDLLTLASGLGLPPGGNASLSNGRVALALRRHD